MDIARYMAKLNRETGYPKYFVINWTKNSTEKIFEIVDALKDSGVKFMMTTSVQSHNPETLQAIKRQNIRLESFQRILEEASKRHFDTYSELILGLPLESYRTFVDGVRKVLSDNLHYHFNLYQCVLIPGTEMADPAYVARYQIQTRRCIMNLGKTVHELDSIPEYEDIVVGTSTMPIEDWKKAHMFGYFTKAIYGFRAGFFILNYLKREYEIDPVALIEFIIRRASDDPTFTVLSRVLKQLAQLQEQILSGDGNETIKLEGVASSLHPETAALVCMLSDKARFYAEVRECVDSFLTLHGQEIDREAYDDVYAYQQAVIPTWTSTNKHVLHLRFDLPAYFSERSPLVRKAITLVLGEGTEFKNADEFLQKQIYGGMIFALLKASPLEQKQPLVAATVCSDQLNSQPSEGRELDLVR